MPKVRVFVQVALVAILGVAVLGSTLRIAQLGGDYEFFDPLIDVKHILTTRYVEPVDAAALQRAAIDGMIESLNDPFTVYIPPPDVREFEKALTGEYVGIGAQVIVRDGWLTIVTPLEGSPAFRAGLMPGDRIVEINAESTFGKAAQDSVDILTGQPGTSVELMVERGGERFPVTIVREQIKTLPVKGFHRHGAEGEWQHLIDPDRRIVYIWLTQFNPGCARTIAEVLLRHGADRGELGGLVLDLRWNPGGVLGEAVALADMFLPSGVIVSTRGRAHPEEVVNARAQGTLPDFPIIVLLNEASASASEVLAGALQENGRAVVLGTRSVGKGSVQSVITLPNGKGAQLKITEQGYYLPSGRSLQRTDTSVEWGVDPTPGFYLPLTTEQVAELLRVRREEDLIRADNGGDTGGDWSDPGSIVERLRDPQLAAALRALQARIDTGEWEKTGRPGPEREAIALDELRRVQRTRDLMLRELGRLERRIAAIETGVPDAAARARRDLWDDTLELTGGTLDVLDPEGNRVVRLRITADDLERWLLEAPLEPTE
mgnify:CR=1 FL=1